MEKKFFRIGFLWAISYTATTDLETSLYAVIIFLAILYLIRTPEERESVGKSF